MMNVRCQLASGVSLAALTVALSLGQAFLMPETALAQTVIVAGNNTSSTAFSITSSQNYTVNGDYVLSGTLNGAHSGLNNTVTSLFAGGVSINSISISNTGSIDNSASTAFEISTVTANTISNSGTITASATNGEGHGVEIRDSTITLLENGGLISSSSGSGGSSWGDLSAIRLALNDQIGSISNTGTLSGYVYGLNLDAATITGNITNTGLIQSTGSSSSAAGILVSSSSAIQGTLNNSGTISSSGSSSSGVYNLGSINSLTNEAAGTISGGHSGIYNNGTIGTLTNSGSISGGLYGIENVGSITSLINSGVISGTGSSAHTRGINNLGVIGVLTNQSGGTISGSKTGIFDGTPTGIGSIVNNGLITGGTYAINEQGSIGAITNSGTIAGNISNTSSNALTINGADASGTIFGTLTGSSGSIGSADKGTISNTSSNLAFASGKLLLNDDINVTGHTLTNTSATLKLANSVTITGNYTQNGGGLVIVASNGTTSYSQLVVTGTATVNNGTVTITGSGLAAGETFTIVHAGTGEYTTGSITATVTGYTATVSTANNGNDLIVTLSGGSSTGYTGKGNAAGGSAAGMGPVLDALANSSNTSIQSLLTTIGNMSVAQQKVVLKQLAPTQIAPASAATTQAASPAGSVIEQHELSLLGNGGETGVAAGSESRDDWVWGQMVGGGSVRAASSNQDGSRAQNFGFVVGYDHQMTPDAVLGIAGSVIKSWSWGMDDNTGSLTKLTSYQLLGYGLQRFGQAFVDGQLVYGFNSYDQTRAINLLGESAYANYDGYHVSAKLGTGYDIPVQGSLVATPMAGWRFTRATTESYSENGAGAANLSVDGSGVNTLTQDLGAKLSWKTETGWGQLSPEARLAWTHDYTRGNVGSSGSMGGVPFATTSERVARDGVRLNLATNLATNDDTTLRLEYEGELRSDYQSHTGLLKFTQAF